MLFVVPPSVDSFERFWKAYPRHIAKKDARKAWLTINPSPHLLETILAALAWQVQQDQWVKDGGAYVPYPATWLRGERWEDERPQTAVTLTDRELKEAGEIRRKAWGRCPHDPDCATYQECVRLIAEERRQSPAIAETA